LTKEMIKNHFCNKTYSVTQQYGIIPSALKLYNYKSLVDHGVAESAAATPHL